MSDTGRKKERPSIQVLWSMLGKAPNNKEPMLDQRIHGDHISSRQPSGMSVVQEHLQAVPQGNLPNNGKPGCPEEARQVTAAVEPRDHQNVSASNQANDSLLKRGRCRVLQNVVARSQKKAPPHRCTGQRGGEKKTDAAKMA